ncbi:YggT family protein [Loigolactobacillus bifermentans]|nr:YggT family protein [Loigolactobacillus bifermentans]
MSAVIIGLYMVLNWLIKAYIVLLMVFVLMSWFPGAYQTKLGEILGRICAPFLNVFYRIVPAFGGISFAPWVAMIVLWLVQRGLYVLASFLLRLTGQ